MATSYQRIRQRKIIYLICIVLLLFLAFAHRIYFIDSAVKEYDISETNLGKVDLGGSISRFVLSSFRGPLVCGLWWEVNALQERHDFKQLELILTALTKLQPHYKGPWKYQGWNLAYNVSVEFDRVEDKYFYISKGIRWLATGEFINRVRRYDPDSAEPDKIHTVGDPDMRAQIAQDISGKMYYSDEQAIFRPLLHLSCIPHALRNPVTLRNNPEKLEQFKATYPRFIRRIRTLQNIPPGDEITLNRELLNFLTEHRDVPSMWVNDETGAAPQLAADAWPRWPNMTNRDLIGKVADQELMQDGLDIARHWYEFSTEMLPPPKTELTGDVTPQEDKFTRTNKNMHSMIFRANPARTHARSATELYKEGWPDAAQKIAEQAYSMWLDLGKQCNLEQPQDKLRAISAKAKQYEAKYKESADRSAPPPEYLKEQNPEEYASAMDNYKCYMFMGNLSRLRMVCRYDYWKDSTDVSRSDIYREICWARYLAEQQFTDWPVCLAHYQRAIALYCLLVKQPLPVRDQMALRLSLLAPNAGTVLAQAIPSVSLYSSSYGSHDTTQEELLDLQDNYMRILARNLAPNRLRAEYQTWLLRQAISSSTLAASTPTASFVPPTFIGTSYLNIDFVEDLVEKENGPFDDIIPQEIKTTRDRDKAFTKK